MSTPGKLWNVSFSLLSTKQLVVFCNFLGITNPPQALAWVWPIILLQISARSLLFIDSGGSSLELWVQNNGNMVKAAPYKLS